MKFAFNWPIGFRGDVLFEIIEGRTDAGIIGILKAHLRAFGSGELKISLLRMLTYG